jgi:hypothetical protein
MATSSQKPSTPPVADKPAAKKAVAAKPKAPANAAAVKTPAATDALPPVAQAAVAAKLAAKKVRAAKTPLKPSSAPTPVLTSEQRHHYVAVAAFYIAERRGFTLGNPAEDWLQAEAEVNRLIASGHFPT